MKNEITEIKLAIRPQSVELQLATIAIAENYGKRKSE